ncbi:hypothetical protein [Microvirga massiliensis]|uniref:hypothetical protein n=1 Tax=Microvirga massiliensis TaxID=1033741 RepID=UPI000A672150|nr:hypothetical protein [Microvirga massiliensis]
MSRRFNVCCPRCGGTGRYDRGACFECRGRRFVLRSRKPRGEPARVRATVDGRRLVYEFYGFTQEQAQEALTIHLEVTGHTMRRDFEGNPTGA